MTYENEASEIDNVYLFCEIVYFILSGREVKNSEKEIVFNLFTLFYKQFIDAIFYNDVEHWP